MSLLYQENRARTYIFLLLIGIGLYSLLPFLLLTLYIHPTADDFSFAIRDTSLDFFTAQLVYYLNWSGRYFGTAMGRVNPLTFDSLVMYKLYAFLLLLLLSGSVYFILRKATEKLFQKKGILALSALLLSLYLLLIPSPAEGFYFFATYATYQFPNILMLLMLGLVYAFFSTRNKQFKYLYIGLAAILCIALVGSNEMALIMTFTTLLLILIANRSNTEVRPYLLFLFTVCIVSCLVAVLAPGNYQRKNDHPNASRFLWSAVYSAFLTFLTFYRWLAPVLAASVLYLVYWGLPLADRSEHSRLFKVDLRMAVLYFLTTIFLMYFAFAWSTGERATPRVENVICFFFIFGWFYLLQVALHTYRHLLQQERLLSPLIPAVALLLFALSLLSIDNNITTAYVDLLSGKAAAYDKALHQRYAELAASDCEECAVATLPAIPKTIYFSDILEGPQNNDMWINRGFADYWDKKAVHLSAPNPPLQDNLSTLRETGKGTLRERSLME